MDEPLRMRDTITNMEREAASDRARAERERRGKERVERDQQAYHNETVDELRRQAELEAQRNMTDATHEPAPCPLDICACGHDRSEHPDDGPCQHGDYHQPTQCLQFRLTATSQQICEGMEEWNRMQEENEND